MGESSTLSLDVYVITSSGFVTNRDHLAVGLAAVRGGATAVQLRAPELDDEGLLRAAKALAGGCVPRGVMFVVNNRVDIALRSEASGAHVGQDDDPRGAREELGRDRVLGVSVSTPDEARAAEDVGADYLGVTVWKTDTKPEAVPVGIEGLRAVVAATSLPVVGVGGIRAPNASQVLAAGAAGVAVVSAVGAAKDPVGATRELAAAVRMFRG